MKITRATFVTPVPRTSYTGLDLEDAVAFSPTNRTISGFVAKFDQVNPTTLVARRLVSEKFVILLNDDQFNRIAGVCAEALVGAGVVPADASWSFPDVGGGI